MGVVTMLWLIPGVPIKSVQGDVNVNGHLGKDVCLFSGNLCKYVQ